MEKKNNIPCADCKYQEILGVSPRKITSRFNPENFSWIDIKATSNNIKYLNV